MLPAIASSFTPRTDTASFSALIAHFESVDIVTAAATVTATLPDATAFSGQTLLVQVSTADGTNHVAFATVSSQTINAASAASLPTLSIVDQTYFFVSDGANWWTIQPVIDLVANVTNTLRVPHGGTGLATITAGNVVVGNGTGNVALAAPTSTTGIPLVSQGSSSTPSFSTAVVAGGGTGRTSLTQYAVLIGEGTGPIDQVAPSATAGLALVSAGSSADPAFGAVALGASGAVSGFLPLANGYQTMSVTVTETIAAGAMINLWASSGLKVRNADNTDVTKQADGFALTGAASGAITIVIGSAPNTQQSSLTVGTRYFLGTAGAVTATAPSSSGDLVQSLGIAVTTTELQVIIGNVTTIA
jgi:hypothetical protein